MKKVKQIIYILIFILFLSTTKSYADNIVIVLDPGHGGSDQGASNSTAGIIERDVNLKIARYLKQYLEEYSGIKVILTHNGFSSGKMELLDRALVGRNNKADMLISLHCNASATSSTITGAEAYVTASTVLPKYNEECSKLANLVLNNLSKLGIKNRGVKTKLSGSEDEVYSDGTRGDYYGIIRYSMKGVYEGAGANIQNGEGIPAVLIEHCYIQNGDEQYLDSDEDIQKLAKADCDAIVEFYGLHLKQNSVSAVTLDKNIKTLLTGDTVTLEATIYPETAEDKTITWSSDNEKVAKVENGEVTAIGEGEATITVTTKDGEYTAKCKITVKDLEIEINAEEIYCLENDKYKLTYKISPYIPEEKEVKIEILDTNIASIDEKNIITANEIGKTNIIIKITEKKRNRRKNNIRKTDTNKN